MFTAALSLVLSTVVPPDIECWTSTRSVTAVVACGDGTFAVATSGGLLRRDAKGRWTKSTIADGLPGNELESVAMSGTRAAVKFGGAWSVKDGPVWQTVSGSLVRATSADTVKAVWGKGLLEKGRPYRPLLPKGALGAVATAADGKVRVVGTSDDGLYELVDGRWSKIRIDEPAGSSIQSLTFFEGSLHVSTLQEGLSERTPKGWLTARLSSASPREATDVGGTLFVRHADGRVDSCKGGKWKLDVLTKAIPRKQARFLATDGTSLFVAQWAGWSVQTGNVWSHHLLDPDLAGTTTTCLLSDGPKMWVGTQGRGLAVLTGTAYEWFDDRHGLKDDWITCLARHGGDVWAGTFVGGLVRVSEGRGSIVTGTEGENVTCLASVDGDLIFGTRNGLYRVDGITAERVQLPIQVTEVQALAVGQGSLWIGTRTGLIRVALTLLSH